MLRADGSIRWTQTRGMVVRDGQGRPVRVVGMDHDVTEQKVAEVALQVREAQQTAVARLARLRGFAPDFGVFAILWSLKHLIYLDIPS
jgi:PAS fold